MGLVIYDIETDQTREVTQADIDRLTAVASAYGRLRVEVERVHAALLAEIKAIKGRGK